MSIALQALLVLYSICAFISIICGFVLIGAGLNDGDREPIVAGICSLAGFALWPLLLLGIKLSDEELPSLAERRIQRRINRAERDIRVLEKRRELEEIEARVRETMERYLSEEVP